MIEDEQLLGVLGRGGAQLTLRVRSSNVEARLVDQIKLLLLGCLL